MSKKTFNVEEFKTNINNSLANSLSSYCSADQRSGMIKTLEMVLYQTGNYHGFTYLGINEVPKGELPGIIVDGTIENTPYEKRFPVGKVDSTRVRYF